MKKQLILITSLTISFSLHSMELMKRGTNWFTRIFLLPSVHQAAHRGDLESVQKHIRMGTDPNQKDGQGWSALVWGCIGGHKPVVECFIKSGADINQKDQYGWTPLTFAAYNGHLSCCEELVEAQLRQMIIEQTKSVCTFLGWLKYGIYKEYYSHWKNLFKEPLRVVMREDRRSEILKELNELSNNNEIEASLRAKYFPEVEEKLK